MKRKLLSSFLEYECPWHDEPDRKCTKKLNVKETLTCGNCGPWDFRRVNMLISLLNRTPHKDDFIIHKRLLKIKKYYEARTT